MIFAHRSVCGFCLFRLARRSWFAILAGQGLKYTLRTVLEVGKTFSWCLLSLAHLLGLYIVGYQVGKRRFGYPIREICVTKNHD